MYSATPRRPDGTFDLIVRVYKNGNISRWLDSLEPGASVNMKPFPPTLPTDRRNPGRYVGLVAYGIGITELYWTALNELQDPQVKEVVLLYATRTMEDQKVFGPELEQLLREPRFRLERVLSRECAAGARTGHVDARMLAEVFPWEDKRSQARFAAAGAKEMMETTYTWLRELGYPNSFKLIRDLTFASLLGR